MGLNFITGTTDAFVDGATSLNTKGLTLDAKRAGYIVSLTAGVAGATGKTGIAIGGSVGVTRTTNTTETGLRNTTGVVSGAVSLNASDDTNIILVAGSGAFGGKAGVGAAVSFSDIENNVFSTVSGVANFKHAGNFDVKATADGDIIAVTGGAGGGDGRRGRWWVWGSRNAFG